MDRYPRIEKIILERSRMKYILPLFCLRISCSALFTTENAVQLTWFEFSPSLLQPSLSGEIW